MKTISLLAVLGITAASVSATRAQDHGHLYVGTVNGSQLNFDNGTDFATETGYVNTLSYTNAGTYSGYYVGNITLAVLPATADFGGPFPNSPAPGAVIYAQLVSVDGPLGGAFGFWDAGALSPSISLGSGTAGTNLWKLSQNDGSPGSDPYGHIHGRRFTATKPGIYTVALRALDLSTNGPGAGPLHTSSQMLKIYFQAGINLKSVTPAPDGVHVIFGGKSGFDWQLEGTDRFTTSTNWISIGNPLTGNDTFLEALDPQAPSTNRFYRVRSSP